MRTPVLGLLLGLILASPVLADRGAIEQTLSQMEQAAMTADAKEYLSHVARTDPIFFKEQENWARDLKRKTPESVVFSIAEPEPDPATVEKDGADVKPSATRRTIATPIFGEKTAKFEMVTTWTMPGEKEGGKRSERSVSYPGVFVLGEDGKWLYAGEDWLVMEAGIEEQRPRDERFQGPDPQSGRGGTTSEGGAKAVQRGARVKYFAGYEDVARMIVDVLPGVRDHVDEGFENHVPRVQEVKIYPGMRHLQESIYLSYVDGLSGWNEPGEAIKIITNPRRASKRGLTGLLAHEYGHVATFEFGEHANDMPWWVLEGVAELSAERFAQGGKDAESMVAGWSRKDALASWEDLADFHKVQDSSARDLQAKVYKQGHHMLMYISDRFGREGRNAWLRSMARGKTIDEATRDALKMSFADLDAQWREHVKAQVARSDAEKAAREEAPKEKDAKKTGNANEPKDEQKKGI